VVRVRAGTNTAFLPFHPHHTGASAFVLVKMACEIASRGPWTVSSTKSAGISCSVCCFLPNTAANRAIASSILENLPCGKSIKALASDLHLSRSTISQEAKARCLGWRFSGSKIRSDMRINRARVVISFRRETETEPTRSLRLLARRGRTRILERDELSCEGNVER
jgi:hypothetical protein